MRTPHTKVITLSAAVEWRKKMRCNRWSVVATNGCFDILHAGHCDLLYRARNFGDGLVVLLNLPLAQEFFILSWPPSDLLLAALAAGATGGLAIELLAWLHRRKFPR